MSTEDPTHAETMGERPMVADSLAPGTPIGRFVVLGDLGRGGMGVLYLAYDPELDRKVALKLFRSKAGKNLSHERIRQLREAQALARLSHPNIVAVYDVGTFDGAVFLALEYIDGHNLEEWTTREEPSVRRIARVVVAAARGLSAAHGAGILHRDVKPENIMIGPPTRVRLVDFGLARAAYALDDEHESMLDAQTDQAVETAFATSGSTPLASSVTMPGSLLGTPNFMAPELFGESDADELSDIYGLSATLYSLLYGRPPLHIKTIADFAKIGSEEISFLPQGRGKPIPSWVRKVLIKGLAFDPKERFQSVNELVQALEHDPAAVLQRRTLVTAALVSAIAVGAGLVTLYQEMQERCDSGADRVATVWGTSQKSRLEGGFQELDSPLATSTWPMVEHSLDEYTELWQHSFRDSCEATYIRRDQSEELFDLRNQCLSDRLDKVAALIEVLTKVDQEMVERAAKAVAGLPSLVPCSQDRQLRLTKTPDLDAETEHRLESARVTLAQAKAQFLAGQFSSAFDTVQPLHSPAESGSLPGLESEVLRLLGSTKTELGEYNEAREYLSSAMVAALAQHRDESAVLILGEMAWVEGNYQQQLIDGFQWLDLAQALAERLGDRPYLEAKLLRLRGSLNFYQGHYVDAERIYRQVLFLLNNLDPQVAIGEMPIHSARGATAMNLAVVLRVLGKTEESLDQYDDAIVFLSKAYGKNHPSVAETRFNRGSTLMDLGREKEALAEIELSLKHLGEVFGDEHPRLGIPLNNLGVILEGQGRIDEAMEYYLKALSIFERAYPEGHLETARALRNLAEVYFQRQELAESRQLATRALAMAQEVAGPRHPEVVGPIDLLARLDLMAGSPEKVIAPARFALEITEQEGISTLRAGFLFYLAQALRQSRQNPDEAVDLAEQARSIFEEGGPRYEPRIEEITRWLEESP